MNTSLHIIAIIAQLLNGLMFSLFLVDDMNGGGMDTFEKCLFKIEHLGIMIVPPSVLPRLANTQTALFASSIIPISATLPLQTI